MTTSVALLRGVNVGKAKWLPMADFRDLLSRRGYADAAGHINDARVFLGIFENVRSR